MSETADIRELAVAAWRLEKWLDNLNSERKMAAKSALRGIKKYISAMGVEVKDPLGSKFDPGLAVEVVNNEDMEAAEEDLIIIETLSPYIYQNAQLVQHARVIIGTQTKTAKVNNEIAPEPAPAPPAPAQAPESANDAPPAEVPEETPAETADGTTHDQIEISADDIERMRLYAKIL